MKEGILLEINTHLEDTKKILRTTMPINVKSSNEMEKSLEIIIYPRWLMKKWKI